MRRYSVQRLLLAASLLPSTCYALSADDLQFSGFGTVGMVLSDSDNYGYRSDLGFDEGVFSGDVDFSAISSLGLQLDALLSKKNQFTFQVLIRDQSNTDIDRYITQAFYKYSISPSFDVRVGRMPLSLFALTEYRDVGLAYPWAMTPTEVYGLFPLRALDGGDISYTFRLDNSHIQVSVFAGETEGDIAALGSFENVKFSNAAGLSVKWGDFNWEVRANYLQVEFDETLPSLQLLVDGVDDLSGVINGLGQLLPQPPFPDELWRNAAADADALDLKGEKVVYMSLSANYSWGQWGVSGEVTRTDSDNIIVPEVFGSYLSLAYAAGQSTMYGVVAYTDSTAATFDDSDVSPLVYDPNSLLLDPATVGPVTAGAFGVLQQQYEAVINGYNEALSFYASDQVSYSVGWRYDVKENIALNVQLTHTIIDDGGGTLWLTEPGVFKAESVNTLFCNLSFTF